MASSTRNKTMVIDADAHVIESERTWDFLEPSDRKYRPVGVTVPGDASVDRRRRDGWFIDGKIRGFRFPVLSADELDTLSLSKERDLRTEQDAREMGDIGRRLRHMDRLGIDVQVLYSTIFIAQVSDNPAIDVAICRAWNRWLAEIWKEGKGRLRWVCAPPMLSLPDAIDEIRFAKEHGAVGVQIRPYEGQRRMTDPYYYPVFAEAERLDLPMACHIANANPMLVDLFTAHDAIDGSSTAAFSLFHVPAMVACQALLTCPISELFPKLRWGIIEANASWVQYASRNASEGYRNRGERMPDHIFRRKNVYVTCENDDNLPVVLQFIDEDNLLIGTDYGHIDPSSNVSAILEFKEKTEISEEVKQKILDTNPRLFYGL